MTRRSGKPRSRRRRKTKLPRGTRGAIVLDSGAVTKLAEGDALACTVVEDLTQRGWTTCIPAVTLAEVVTGHARPDAAVDHLVRRLGQTIDCDPALARSAGALRAHARKTQARPSGIDAIVAALAEARQPSVVLTSDPEDLDALLVAAEQAMVMAI